MIFRELTISKKNQKLVWTVVPIIDKTAKHHAGEIAKKYYALRPHARPAMVNVRDYGNGQAIALALAEKGLPVTLTDKDKKPLLRLKRRGLIEDIVMRLFGY
jgi:hypothetical protein